MQKVRTNQCEALIVHGSKKRICARKPPVTVDKSNQALADIRQVLLARYTILAPIAP
jgi:hypothetical protein